MNLENGSNNQYLENDIEFGSLVAYLVEDSDRNINKPMARVLLKPFHSSKDMVLVADKTYGAAPATFRRAIDRFLEKFNAGKEGFFTLDPDLYNDGTSYIIKGDSNVEDFVEELVGYFNEADSDSQDQIESELIAIARNTKNEKTMRELLATENYNIVSELMANIHTTREIFKRIRGRDIVDNETFIQSCPFFDLVKIFDMVDVVDNFTGTIDKFDDAITWLRHDGGGQIDSSVVAELFEYALSNLEDSEEENLIENILQLTDAEIPAGSMKAEDVATLVVKKDCAQILSNFDAATLGEVFAMLNAMRDDSIGSDDEEEFINNNSIDSIKLTSQTIADHITQMLRSPVKLESLEAINNSIDSEILELVRSSSLKVATVFSEKSHFFNGSYVADTGSLTSRLGLPNSEYEIDNFVSGFSIHRMTANILKLPAKLVDRIIQNYSLERFSAELTVGIAEILKSADFELSEKGKKLVNALGK